MARQQLQSQMMRQTHLTQQLNSQKQYNPSHPTTAASRQSTKKLGSQRISNVSAHATTRGHAMTAPIHLHQKKEKNQYPQLQLTLDVRTKLRNRCVTNLTSLSPPVEWCGKTSLDDEYDEKTDSYPPPGCSHTTNGGGSGAFQHVMIFPSAKLAFCGIPKVGITQWVQFLRFVAGAKDYPSVPHYKLDTDFFQFDKLEPSIQKEIWNSEEWTWAAFLRDPAERILSAYLDKAAPGTRAHPDIKEKISVEWYIYV
eukprot:g5370.t1 g5370   contig2:411565-412326(-)